MANSGVENLYTELVGEHKDGKCFLEYDSENGKRHYCLDVCIQMGRASRSCDQLAEDLISSICSPSPSHKLQRPDSARPYWSVRRVITAVSFPLLISVASQLGFWPSSLASFLLFPAAMTLAHSRLARKATPSDIGGGDSPLLHWGLLGLLLSCSAWLSLGLTVLRVLALALPAGAIYGIAVCRSKHSEPNYEEEGGYLHLYIRRGKHCTCCGVYRDRYDHHCLWINACVHRETHRAFVATLALACLCASMLPSSVLLPHLLFPPSTPSLGQGLVALERAHAQGGFIYTLSVVDFVAFVGMMSVLALQLYGICTNRTTNEIMNRRKYYDEQMRPLPPNMGPLRNLALWARGDWGALAPRGGDEPQEHVEEAHNHLLLPAKGEDE